MTLVRIGMIFRFANTPPLSPHEPHMDFESLKGRPSYPFKKIAAGVAFTPKLEAIISEATLLADNFKAKLVLIHVGTHSPEKEATLMEICANLGIDREVKIIWGNGETVTTLLEICKKQIVDLLVLGARRHENVFRFYMGSVARSLCRQAKCSLLLLTEPKITGSSFKRIVVDCVEHPKTESTLNTAYYFADLVGTTELRTIREIDQKELDKAAAGGKANGDGLKMREKMLLDAELKLRSLTADRVADRPRVQRAVLSGRPGFTVRKYTEECAADLLVIHSPDSQYRLMDRIFTHDLEHILEHLPSNMLIVHTRIAAAG